MTLKKSSTMSSLADHEYPKSTLLPPVAVVPSSKPGPRPMLATDPWAFKMNDNYKVGKRRQS